MSTKLKWSLLLPVLELELAFWVCGVYCGLVDVESTSQVESVTCVIAVSDGQSTEGRQVNSISCSVLPWSSVCRLEEHES